jgi:adenylosuccinate synthase
MKQAFLTVDLGFGDAGKGSIVDFLTRHYDAHTVIRYNGGAQAGHRVVVAGSQPKEHVFSQFGSGTLAGAGTHLSRFMLLEPLGMMEEERHLRTLGVRDAFGLTTIDEGALLITPFQMASNRLKEVARQDQRHGSCGMGIGETMDDFLHHAQKVLFVRDLKKRDILHKKLRFMREINLQKVRPLEKRLPESEQAADELALLHDERWIEMLMEDYQHFAQQINIVPPSYLPALLQQPGSIIFEAAQGVLLDEWYGFHPHTTWSTTTLANADRLLQEAAYQGAVTRIGITRAYATRHGSGPFVSEDEALTRQLPDSRNGFDAWQHNFRVGWLDLVMLRYALDVVGKLDYLAVTCLDRLQSLSTLHYCNRYQGEGFSIERLVKSPIPRSLPYQEQLTHKLNHCRPILQAVANSAALLEVIEKELALPVGLISEGASAEDKRFLAWCTSQVAA